MTSAPRSPRHWAHSGPARTLEKSTTWISCRAFMLVTGLVEFSNDCLTQLWANVLGKAFHSRQRTIDGLGYQVEDKVLGSQFSIALDSRCDICWSAPGRKFRITGCVLHDQRHLDCNFNYDGLQQTNKQTNFDAIMLSPGGETPNTRDCLQLACGTGRTVRLPLITDGAAATEDGRCDCHCGLAGNFPLAENPPHLSFSGKPSSSELQRKTLLI